MGELPQIILIIIILIWCDAIGIFHDWAEATKQIYRDLYPFVGKPNQLDTDSDGGAVWWKPKGLELMSCISLLDFAEDSDTPLDHLQADVCMKLYAGYQLSPSQEAISRQIQQLSEIPGVTFHSDQRAFQITAQSAHELLSIAHKMTRVTQGLEPSPKRIGKIRDRLQTYTHDYLTKQVS
jgi:hypothetical protein